MKRAKTLSIVIGFLLFNFQISSFAQTEESSPEQVCSELLSSISVSQGEEVNWDYLKALFHPAAQIHLQNPKSGKWIQWTVNDFQKNTAYSQIGFEESALQRTVSTSSKIAHVVEYYEAKVESTGAELHGHNYYTLVLTESGWKIMDLMWEEIKE